MTRTKEVPTALPADLAGLLDEANRRVQAAEGERDAALAAAVLFEKAAGGAVALEEALRRCVNVLDEVKHWLMPTNVAKEVTEALTVARGVLEGVGDQP